MALPVGLMLALSGLTSAVGQGIASGSTTSANQQQAGGFARQRMALQPLLERLANPDFSSLDRRATRDMTRASDQITSNRAASGMMDAGRGGADAMTGEVLSGILAQLADAKSQVELQNNNLRGQILSNPAFSAPDPSQFNPGMDALLGLLGGGMAGVGQGLGTLMGTETGLEALGEWGKPKPAPTPEPDDTVAALGQLDSIFNMNAQAPTNAFANFPRTGKRMGSGRPARLTPYN